jgi:hypothetical protein
VYILPNRLLPTSTDIFHDLSSCIHTYLFLFLFHRATIPNIAIRACYRCCHQPRYCPNCKHAVPPLPEDEGSRWKLYNDHALSSSLRSPFNDQLELSIANDRFTRSHRGDGTWGDSNQEFYNRHASLTDYQAELAVRDLSEFQTSGCNTPRRSAETLNSSRFSGDVDFLDEAHFDSLV